MLPICIQRFSPSNAWMMLCDGGFSPEPPGRVIVISLRIKDGRFGAYVTDGTTNVTIPRGQTADDITFQIAVQMLADKRAKGPAPKPLAWYHLTVSTDDWQLVVDLAQEVGRDFRLTLA